MRPMNWLAVIALSVGLASGAVACSDKGSLESAGEKMDDAVDDITHPGEGAAEKALRKTGEKMDEVADDISDTADDITK